MNITRKDKTYRLHTPPLLKATEIKLKSGKIMRQGDVYSRTSNIAFEHPAVFYGVGFDNRKWMLELNQDGVRFVTFRDFLGTQTTYWKKKYKRVKWETIYGRALEREPFRYSFDENNCDMFVNYVMKGMLESSQTTNAKFAAEMALKTIFLRAVEIQKHDETKQGLSKVTLGILEKLNLNKHPHRYNERIGN